MANLHQLGQILRVTSKVDLDMTQTVEISQDKKLTTKVARLFPLQGEWTEADYFSLPETNKIVELSEGRLIISPSPTSQHQRVLGRLYILFSNHVLTKKLGEVIIAPMDTRLYEGVVRQPDIAFMSNDHLDRITEKMWGVPDLVVEVLSKGTAKEDKGDKFKEYERAGVSEYWIVDPSKKSITIYTLKDGIYELLGRRGPGEVAKSKLLNGLEVSINDVMSNY
jgi:Uma2 family endonuclease